MNKSFYLPVLLLLCAFLLVGCELPGVGMPDDGPPIPVSEEAAASLEQKAAEAASGAGETTVTLTQEEITSYLALRLGAAAAENGQPNPLRNPQLYLKENGTMVLRGEVLFEERSQPIRIVAQPQVANGSLELQILEGRIGMVPVPGPILELVEGEVARAILMGQDYARLEEVLVGAGTLTIRGQPA